MINWTQLYEKNCITRVGGGTFFAYILSCVWRVPLVSARNTRKHSVQVHTMYVNVINGLENRDLCTALQCYSSSVQVCRLQVVHFDIQECIRKR